MKYLIQSLFTIAAFGSFAQTDLPIYDNLNYVKEYEMILNDNSVFVSSPFAKPELDFPKMDLDGKKIKKITYLYSHNNKNPKYAQTSLSDKRYANLMNELGDENLKDIEWQTQVQIGCGNVPCSRKLDHGFIIEFEGPESVIGHDNLKVQKKMIRSSEASTVTASGGTKVDIPANAFVDAFGNPVEGNVEIRIQEAITPEAIVLGNMKTVTDDGKILQSKGMVKITAHKGGTELYLKDGAEMTVDIPTDFEEGYSYFTGDAQDGELVWTDPVPLSATKTEPVLADGELLNRVNQMNNRGKVGIEKLVSEDADMENPQVVLQGGRVIALDEEFLIYVEAWTSSGKAKNKRLLSIDLNIADSVDITVKREDAKRQNLKDMGFRKNEIQTLMNWFENDKVEIRNAVFDKDNLEDGRLMTWPKFKDYGGNISTDGNLVGANTGTGISKDVSNAFKMSKLGWANVDRFYHNSTKIEFAVAQEEVEDLETFEISLVVPSYNIFIPGYEKQDGNYGFTHSDYEKKVAMPVGDMAYIIAIGEKEGKTFFEMKQFTIGDNKVEVLSLQEKDREAALESIKNTL